MFLDLFDDEFFSVEVFISLLKTEEFVGEVRNIYLTGKTFAVIFTLSLRHFFYFSSFFPSFYKLFYIYLENIIFFSGTEEKLIFPSYD